MEEKFKYRHKTYRPFAPLSCTSQKYRKCSWLPLNFSQLRSVVPQFSSSSSFYMLTDVCAQTFASLPPSSASLSTPSPRENPENAMFLRGRCKRG
eukprot:750679-Hanusia_phi.AAC.5